MSSALQSVIDAFRRLSSDEQKVAVAVMLRSASEMDYPTLDDEAIAQIADQSFQAYAAHEACEETS